MPFLITTELLFHAYHVALAHWHLVGKGYRAGSWERELEGICLQRPAPA